MLILECYFFAAACLLIGMFLGFVFSLILHFLLARRPRKKEGGSGTNPTNERANKIYKNKETETTCPECGAKNPHRMGIVSTRQGKKPRFKCKECGKTFYK